MRIARTCAFACLLAMAVIAAADPAAELRELDRQLRDGEISKAEYDQRWDEIISAGMRPTRVPRLGAVPHATPRKPQRLPNEFSIAVTGCGLDADDVVPGASAMLGRFITPALQLSAGGFYGTGEIDGLDHDLFGAFAVADLHGDTSREFVPYVGAGAGWLRVERDSRGSEDWFWTAHAGLKQYLSRDTAMKYEIGYTGYGDLDLSGVTVAIGVCFLF
jgi:hypothetical protein